jgi:hypothetical protein
MQSPSSLPLAAQSRGEPLTIYPASICSIKEFAENTKPGLTNAQRAKPDERDKTNTVNYHLQGKI